MEKNEIGINYIIKKRQPHLNVTFDENLDSDCGCILVRDINFTAKKKDKEIPSTARFVDIKYTPANYNQEDLIKLLTTDITAYVNNCIKVLKEVNIKEFIDLFNENNDSVELLSIQCINVSKIHGQSTRIDKNDILPNNEQAIGLKS